MKILSVIVLFLAITLLQLNSYASLQGDADALLKIRASNHNEFMRIVLEGPEALIAQGRVNREDKNISVKFSDTNFAVQQDKVRIPFSKKNDTIVFALNDTGEMKVFSLDDPSRIVIDVYSKEKTSGNDSGVQSAQKNRAGHPAAEVTKAAESSRDKVVETIAKDIAKNGIGRMVSVAAVPAKAVADPEPPAGNTVTSVFADEIDEEAGVISDGYKKIWHILKKDKNPYRVLSELRSNKPGDPASLAVYHYIYGVALNDSRKYLESIYELRLAYIYATNNRLKEAALFRRAEAYKKIGFAYEAVVNYQVFIRDFPSSKYIQKAHLGLANSLSVTGYFSEAIEHYGESGNSPEVLFNMANALQKLERVDEAKKAYDNAMLVDRRYPEGSPETYYLRAENLRMTGKTDEAGQILSSITTGPYRDSANISLGLIAMDEANYNEALQYFQTVQFTRDMKVKVKALFNMSLAFLKQGRMKETISTLEEVRKNYPDSSMYNEALLVLSRLYRQEGKMKEAVSLLKELVYGLHPPVEAFSELETLLLAAGERPATDSGSNVSFSDLWRETGKWMLDASRAEFLLTIAEKLRPEGKPFMELCSWLAENTTGKVKRTAAFELANYYAGLQNMPAAEKYVNIIRDANLELKIKGTDDSLMRVEARVNHINKNTELALKNIMSIKEFSAGDIGLAGEILFAAKQAGLNVKQATAFYEKMIGKLGGEAEDYIRLADVLYDENEEKALSNYREAYEMDPKNEWAAYRIALIVDMPETGEMFGKLQNGDSLLGRVAKTKIMEINLITKIEEVYQ